MFSERSNMLSERSEAPLWAIIEIKILLVSAHIFLLSAHRRVTFQLLNTQWVSLSPLSVLAPNIRVNAIENIAKKCSLWALINLFWAITWASWAIRLSLWAIIGVKILPVSAHIFLLSVHRGLAFPIVQHTAGIPFSSICSGSKQ